MRRINKIVIHCSATPIDKEYTFEQLIKDHQKRGIRSPGGYHFYITRSGQRHIGRLLSEIGAHAKGHNYDSVGICYEGGIIASGNANNPKHAIDSRTDAQKKEILKCIEDTFIFFGDYQDMSHVKIIGHRDLSPDKNKNGIIEPHEYMKQCPCFDAADEYKNFNMKEIGNDR